MKSIKEDAQLQTEEMKYLAELIMAQMDGRMPLPVPMDIEVKQLIRYAMDAHMEYLILSSLIKLPVSAEEKQEIQRRLMCSTMRTLAQVNAVREIEQRFELEGIKFQVLKGAILKHVYPSPEMREMSDIDIMVYDRTLDHAQQVLNEMGYVEVEAIKHHVIYSKAPFLILEAHWALYDKNLDVNQDIYFNDHFRAKSIPGKKYSYQFSTEDFYVYMVAHMAKHFYENGCGIRNLLDIYIYLQKYSESMNMQSVEAELTKCGLNCFEMHIRKLAFIWLQQQESTDFYNHLFQYMLDCGRYGKGENGIWGQLAKRDITGKNIRIHYYFPEKKYMKEQYVWLQKYPWLLPMAWCIRAFQGISRGALERGTTLAHADRKQIETTLQIYRTLKLDFRK